MKISPLSILFAGTFLSTSAVAITLEPTLEDSVISYSEGTASNYNFTVQEADADGNLTTKYYKIDIDESKLSSSSSISWTEVDETKKDESNVVAVNLPNNQTKYFKYAYTAPSGYETITESENISVVNPADSETHKYVGAAINNASGNDYGDINEKVFINNKVTANIEHRGSDARKLYVYGGAIFNQGEIGDVIADFIGNSIDAVSGSYTSAISLGGAVYNSGTIDNITGYFISNYAKGTYAYGGAVYNSGTIDNITGDFIGNYARGTYAAYGGAVYNSGTIGNITGYFIGNYAKGAYAYGGAIYNSGTINSIYGSFIGNHAIHEGGNSNYGEKSYGGAIYNSGEITNIVADFVGNYATNPSKSTFSEGGAIVNSGRIDSITGNFIGNYTSDDFDSDGGAIYNEGTIGDITGDFIGNYANSSRSGVDGGTIYNRGTIGDITGDFIGNYAIGDYRVEGGAIYTCITGTIGATIANITGDFIGNYAKSISEIAYGGAIYGDGNSWSSIGNITGDFIGNYAEASHNAEGGAIFNGRKIGNITGNFIGNYAKSISESAYGGAISNSFAIIGDITGNFIDNYTSSSLSYGSGGAIENSCGTIGHIIGNFINNYSTRAGGAIANSEGYIEGITGNFIKNHITTSSDAYGGAIYVSSADGTGTIGNIVGNFINNYVYSSDGYATGGAISNNAGKIGNITGNFTENYAYGYNEALGGAIYNMNYDWQETGVGIDVISGSFVDNYVQAEGYAYGGAIFHEGGDLTFTSKGKDYKISGNYTQDSRGKINNAIWMQNRKYHGPELPANIDPNSINISLMDNSNYEPLIPSLNFNITKNGSYTIDDQIDGGYYYGMQEYNSEPSEPVERYGYGYNLNISGDACTQCEWNSVKFNNLVNNVNNLTVTKSQMALGKDAVVNVVNNYIAKSNPYLRLDLDAVNKKVGQLNIGGNLEGTTSVIVNVLKNKETTEKNSIVFATAQNHSLSEEDAKKSFEVYRVVGSPYMWAISYNDINKTWGLYSTSDVNDYTEDCTKPETPEVFDGFMPTLDRIKSGVQVVDYISDVEALPNSAFAYEEATSGDNSFSFTDTNAYGLETDKAYKIVLKPEEFSTSSDLTFKADNNGPIEVQLPNGETQYFSYEYTGDESDAAIGYNKEGSGWLNGGAVYNDTDMGDLTADFVENYISSSDNGGEGGAIFNDGTIGNITGDFIGNHADGDYTYGGAIENYDTIGNITGSFIGNYAHSGGGAIDNSGNSIGNITGDFIGNYVEGIEDNADAYGGAIINYGDIGNITGDFISNHVKGNYPYGGAINNEWGYKIGNITGDFIGNYAEGKYMALGGAIYTYGNTEYVYDDGSSSIYEIGTITGSFIDNYVKVTDESSIALGGAIFVDSGELTFKADGITNRFIGNYVENADGSIVNNAIWVNNYDGNGTSTLNFEVTNGGGYIFDDEIDGGFYDWNDEAPIKDGYGYNVNIYGDVCPQCIVNSVIFNSKVKNVYNLTLDTTQMVLGKDAHIEIVNDYIAQNNPYLRLNVDAVNGKTGQLEIGGQVIGTTQVIANIVNYKDVRGEESIVFATAVNDTTGDEESFKIFRTVGSPYKWYVDYDESAKTWGLAMGEEANDYEEDCYPDPNPKPEPEPNPVQPLGPIEVEPEIIGFEALQSAGLSQTNGMVYNIMRKVGVNRLYCPGCGFYDYNWNGEPFHNVWVDTTYNGLTIEAPVEIDAKVWGIEAGADIQKDLNNKLGIFVSYRQGNYEMDGKGKKYYSKVGSELDIDSYLAGLYYRYDNNNWYAFATLYGGMQNAEIKTDDGVSADTDGLEFGGSAEIGYSHALNKTVYITPSLGVFYSQISYDDASDDYGKTVEYGDLKQVELEAGLKLSKAVYTDNGTASIYVKPSVVQTLIDGDEINITEIGKVDTIEDQTLGRIEIGGSYGFNDNWSAYGWANYTFGSDYEATSLGAGLNYAW